MSGAAHRTMSDTPQGMTSDPAQGTVSDTTHGMTSDPAHGTVSDTTQGTVSSASTARWSVPGTSRTLTSRTPTR
ncbi:hypothetical protein EDD27_7249 [Nonomuraea polychroma]|uniref:Uncharacterized protein n=1 Tax=Nonomuraea polychroma TaxID=46176 RepID=A0A438MFI5_9ACTN|nr:hypothetical protein EDD27_7249 [Nonomuraea polychroma]